MNTKMLHVTWFCAGLLACSSPDTPSRNVAVDSRFWEVAQSPQNFDGQVVTFRAWISLRHEDRNLWATWKDHQSWDTTRCISLANYGSLESMEASIDGRLVEVTGVIINDASKDGTVLRLGACRDVALELVGASSIKTIVR